MELPSSRCPGCGATLAAGALPYRGYYNCSAECWSEYTLVLAAEYQDPALFAQVHQLTVDAFAVQHAGGPQPDKSVCVHLVGLQLVLVRGLSPSEVSAHLQRLSAAVKQWPHFATPTQHASTTAHSVVSAATASEHAAVVRTWAAQEWAAWSTHHAAVARLAENCFVSSASGA